jgi:hypothetical protein
MREPSVAACHRRAGYSCFGENRLRVNPSKLKSILADAELTVGELAQLLKDP